jgi:RNase P/RNase MRP subunit POP5
VKEVVNTRRTNRETIVVILMIVRLISGDVLAVRVMNTEVTITGLKITMSEGNATMAKERMSCIERYLDHLSRLNFVA